MGTINKIIGKKKTSYRARYYVTDQSGKRIQKGKYFNRFKDARDYLLNAEHSLRQSVYIEPSKTTVKEYLDEWISSCESSLAPNTVRGYKRNIYHACNHIGHICLQGLTPLNIQKTYKLLSSAVPYPHLSGTSLLYIHRTLSRAFSQAEKLQIINHNPFKHVDAPKKEYYKASYYDPNEVQKLVSKSYKSDIYIAIILAVSRGLRRNEILALRWQDVDFKNKRLNIDNSIYWEKGNWTLSKTKSVKSKRSLPLSPKLLLELKLQKQKQIKYKESFWNEYYKSDFICTYKDGSLIQPGSFSNIFIRLLSEYNLRHIRFHDLRHTAASLMLSEGIAMKVVSDLLGHSSISITADLYSHVLDDLKKEAASIMDKFI